VFEIIAYILIGGGVALLSSFLGFGGGTLIVPLLPLVSSFDIKTTIATSLAIVTLNAANNTFSFHKKKLIPWKLVLTISMGSVFFGVMSSKLTSAFDADLVRWIVIGVFLIIVLITYLGAERVPLFIRKNHISNQLIAGAFAGMVAGLGGIGGATILIPILIVGRWTTNTEVAPTGNAINMLTAASAVLTLIFSQETVEWRAVFIILLSSTFFSIFARKKQHLLSEVSRRHLIIGFLIFVILLQTGKALKLF
jgi:uncharacterized membrane protein YfcA